MTIYYSVSNHLPNQNDWTTDQYRILNELIQGTGNILFEKENSNHVLAFPQCSMNDIDQLTRLEFDEDSFFSLVNYFDKMDNFGLYRNSVIGHGNSHGVRVAWLCNIISTMDHLSLNQTLILVIAGLFHDVGRTWQKLDDQYHGEKSYSRLSKALNSSEDDYHKITTMLNRILYNALKLSSPLTMKDIKLMRHIISIHSLDQYQKKVYEKRHSLSMIDNFISLTHFFEDCDALDRVRFEGNLNIHYLNTKSAKLLIHYAKQMQKIF